jgi:hypothetical protein
VTGRAAVEATFPASLREPFGNGSGSSKKAVSTVGDRQGAVVPPDEVQRRGAGPLDDHE